MRFIDTLEKPKHLRLKSVLKKQPSLKRFFGKQSVNLVFLHGSLAHDELKSLSDIDIAILFKNEQYSYGTITKIEEKLSALLGREDVDLMVLNSASPLACMQVLCNGKNLYARSQKILTAFRLRTIQRFLATQYLRESFNRYMKATILRKQ